MENGQTNGDYRTNKRYLFKHHRKLSCLAEVIKLHDSVLKRQLANTEEEFLHAAEFGDVPTVKRILERNKEINVDCIDALGRTALRLAVKNEHLEVVEILLDKSSGRHIYEAVLQAISAGHVQIAETILKHRRYMDMWKELRKLGDDDHFFNTALEESQFSPDITPLILAAQKNQYEIVQLLLLRGEIIHKPHKFHCNCLECTNKMKFDKLRSAKYRLNAYRGLASEAYISLSSKDPILTAFELGDELKQLSSIEKYFKKEYKDLADNLSDYVVRLLDRVRTQEELEVVLNKTGKPSENKYESLARFNLALHYKQKKFAAHPSCQQRLVSTWYTGMEHLERSSWPRRIWMFTLFMLSYPFLVIVHIFTPSKKIVKILHYPCIKFICHTLSFLAFLAIIIVSTAEASMTVSRNITLQSEDRVVFRKYQQLRNLTKDEFGTIYGDNFPMRQTFPTKTEFLLSLWLLGFACQECSQLFRDGFFEYIKSMYNIMDIALLCVYFSSFTLRYVTMYKLHAAIDFLRNADVVSEDKNEMLNAFYWINADRYWWEAFDPINMSEGMFATANILSFSRISYLLPANEILGPLQISLGRMLTDILKFFSLFLLVLIAFMVGLHNLFWYYGVHKNIEVTDHNFGFPVEEHFGNIIDTFRTVFWSVFGRGDTNMVRLGQYDNQFTEDVGYWIFGLYNTAMVIVLLNMLIAMMSRSFQNITEDSDAEWKFARSSLYMDYIASGSTLPVPLNLCGVPRAIFEALHRLCCSKKQTEEEAFARTFSITENGNAPRLQDPHQKNGIEVSAVEIYETNRTPEEVDRRKSTVTLNDPGSSKNYQKVIQTIIQRYIFDMQREAEVTEDDFEEIKQDISSFRYEILNHLKVRETIENTMAAQLSHLTDTLCHVAPGSSQPESENPPTSSWTSLKQRAKHSFSYPPDDLYKFPQTESAKDDAGETTEDEKEKQDFEKPENEEHEDRL